MDRSHQMKAIIILSLVASVPVSVSNQSLLNGELDEFSAGIKIQFPKYVFPVSFNSMLADIQCFTYALTAETFTDQFKNFLLPTGKG